MAQHGHDINLQVLGVQHKVGQLTDTELAQIEETLDLLKVRQDYGFITIKFDGRHYPLSGTIRGLLAHITALKGAPDASV